MSGQSGLRSQKHFQQTSKNSANCLTINRFSKPQQILVVWQIILNLLFVFCFLSVFYNGLNMTL